LPSSPLVAGLTGLDLSVNSEVGAAGGHAFAAATQLRHLERLRLAFCDLGPEGAAALASAGHLGSLRCLDLGDNQLRDEGVRAIALAQQWVGLRELDLSTTEIGPDGQPFQGHCYFRSAMTLEVATCSPFL